MLFGESLGPEHPPAGLKPQAGNEMRFYEHGFPASPPPPALSSASPCHKEPFVLNCEAFLASQTTALKQAKANSWGDRALNHSQGGTVGLPTQSHPTLERKGRQKKAPSLPSYTTSLLRPQEGAGGHGDSINLSKD